LARETAEPGEGQMGEVLTAISLILGSGVSLGQLLVSIAAWRATRPRPYRVSVEFGDRTIAIETSDADEALEIARRLEAD
jgi:predicted nucleic acid-binding protein